MTDRTNVTMAIKHRNNYMIFRWVYFYLTLAHSKEQSQGHTHFDCDYLFNGDRWGKHYFYHKYSFKTFAIDCCFFHSLTFDLVSILLYQMAQWQRIFPRAYDNKNKATIFDEFFKMHLKNISELAGFYLHKFHVIVHKYGQLYSSMHIRRGILAKQWNSKRLIMKITVNDIYNLIEFRRPNVRCRCAKVCKKITFLSSGILK